MVIRKLFVVAAKSVVLDKSDTGLDEVKYIGTLEGAQTEDVASLYMEKKEWDCLEVGSTITMAMSTVDRA